MRYFYTFLLFLFLSQSSFALIEFNTKVMDSVFRVKERLIHLQAYAQDHLGQKLDLTFEEMKEYNLNNYSAVLEKKDYKNRLKSFIDELNRNLKVAEAIRKKAEAHWEKKNKKRPAEEEGYLYGNKIKIKTNRLGVILDNSGSMSRYLPKLRAHIEKNFKNAVYKEVLGCSLYTSKFDHGYLFIDNKQTEFNPFAKVGFPDKIEDEPYENTFMTANDVLSLIRVQIEYYKVDTIYWFCDLQDKRNGTALKALEALLLKNKVKLYIHIPKRSKSFQKLEATVKKSGGQIYIKRP